jgi:hypothetical protein
MAERWRFVAEDGAQSVIRLLQRAFDPTPHRALRQPPPPAIQALPLEYD